MSDPQDELTTSGTTRSDVRVPVVVSFASDDRDWADWVRTHLDGLGQRHELLQPPLPAGTGALQRIAELRRNGAVPLVIVSDALLAGAGRSLDLDRLDTTALPLVLVLIEDVALPPEWVGAARAAMFEAADDYDGSRALLLGALETVLGPSGPDPSPPAYTLRTSPAPLVVIDPFPAPTPAPPPTGDEADVVVVADPRPDAPAEAAASVPVEPTASVPVEPTASVPVESAVSVPAPAGTPAAGPAPMSGVGDIGPTGPVIEALAPAPAPPPSSPAPTVVAGSMSTSALADALRRHVDRSVDAAPLPDPRTRPGVGLLGLGTGTAVEAAGRGGAAVTETEEDRRAPRQPVARRRKPVLPRPEIEGRPAVLRLPFEAVARRWSVDAALGALDRGLRQRWGERPSGDTGLFARDSVASPVTDAVVAAVGALGTGTTTVALAHAHRNLDRVDVLWWVRGVTTETVRADLHALAVAVGIDASDTAGLLEGLRDWLETTEHPWLIVIDGLQPGVALDGLLPAAGRGHVVVTTRTAPAGLQFVSVNPPGVGAARRALAGAAGPTGDDGPTAAALEQIAAALAPHPWALAIAAALLGTGAVDAVLLAARLERTEVPDGFVAPTEPADAVALAALEVLGLGSACVESLLAAAVLAPAPLGTEVIVRPDDHVGRGLGAALLALGDEQVALVPAAAAAIRRLATPALLEQARRRATDLIDRTLPDQAGASTTDLYAPHAMALVGEAGTDPADAPIGRLAWTAETWRTRLADQAGVPPTGTGAVTVTVTVTPVADDVTGASAAPALITTADIPAPVAESPADAVVEIVPAPSAPIVPVPTDVAAPETVAVVPVVAAPVVVEPAAPVAAAPAAPEPGAVVPVVASPVVVEPVVVEPVVVEPVVDEPVVATVPPAGPVVAPAVAGGDGAGPDDGAARSDSTTGALERLRMAAEAAAAAGDHDAAVEHLDQRAALAAVSYGADDLRTLGARTDAALALAIAGRRNRSNQALTKILADAERAYGPDHAATVVAKQTLATSHAELGRDEIALLLRTEVLETRERTQGAHHPQTLTARSNLANSLAVAGRSEEALAMRQTVAEIREATLGSDHPQTTAARNNLANSYADTGRHDQALVLRQQVFDVRERTLGPSHPLTITARNNLANSLAAVGRADEARAQRERTLADSERVLGPDHPHTVTARANLAFTDAAPAPQPGPAESGAPTAIGPAKIAPAMIEAASGGAEGPDVAVGDGAGRKRRFWFFRRR